VKNILLFKFQPQPTKITPSSKAAPTLSNSLQSAQAEIGRSASFIINYGGEEPITVKWFHDGKQIRSAFDKAVSERIDIVDTVV
jgi:hypothetical protein